MPIGDKTSHYTELGIFVIYFKAFENLPRLYFSINTVGRTINMIDKGNGERNGVKQIANLASTVGEGNVH